MAAQEQELRKLRTGVASVIKSKLVAGMAVPFNPFTAKKQIPDISGLEKMATKDLAKLAIKKLELKTENTFGVADLKITMNNGQILQGGSGNLNKLIPHQGVRKIEITVAKDETYISSIAFTYKDDSVRVGDDQTLQTQNGRVENFEIDEDEQLIGAEIDTNGN